MEQYGHEALKNVSKSEWTPSALKESKQEEAWGREMYPERVGVPDCNYFMRTGFCGYGNICRYNHPPSRHQVEREVQAAVDEYPERAGKSACQHYLRMGRCKFGASCKFYHPRSSGGSLNVIPLNVYGFPLRPERIECSYYLRTGHCKYGINCIFHHPQPTGISLPAAVRPFNPTVQTLSAPTAEQQNGRPTSFMSPRPLALPGSYVTGAYGPMMYHPAVLPLTNWRISTTFTQASAAAPSSYGISQLSTSATTFSQTYHPLVPFPGALFPERHGQPECQFYMKTGNCKFGSSCKYNHPPEVLQSKMNFSFSPLGLPLRPGVRLCSFYMHKGRCSFGHVCKFDHPMETVKYSSLPHLTNVPVASYSDKLA